MNLIDKLHASWRASQQRYAPRCPPRPPRLAGAGAARTPAGPVRRRRAGRRAGLTLLIEPPLKTLNQYRDELPKLRAQAAQVADLTAQADLLRRRAPPPPAPCPPPKSWPPA